MLSPPFFPVRISSKNEVWIGLFYLWRPRLHCFGRGMAAENSSCNSLECNRTNHITICDICQYFTDDFL